ncbi:MAG: 2-oxo acid dehydrogenase subunit E2, partial [Chloroflexota bacterium]
PHIYVTMEIDMAEAMLLRKQINESGASDVKVSVNDMVIKAAAKALMKFPSLNSSYAFGSDGQPGVVQHPHVHVSVAVAVEDGLLAPVVKDADTKSVGAIAADIRELARRARDGKSKQTDLEGGTFQVSNMGMFDVVEFVSIVSVPQAASLSVGTVRETPVVRDGKIVIGQVMNVTLSVDHRVADGATAAQYLQELKRLLQAPMGLLV